MRDRLVNERGGIAGDGCGDEVRNARFVSGYDECLRYPSPCRWTDHRAVHEQKPHRHEHAPTAAHGDGRRVQISDTERRRPARCGRA
jgi:hypothetical protein